ncbi:DEAD/DEAH box helicase [Sinorhizobium meliloti]|uniref:DEAD/DEAH box helicase n=1 Tax=Rhizobium meliloti TaxID=382 RepID=UPI000FDACE06|nr:DEAD/DEAH box helicase [Sinorhizobium meliloti]RVG07962.1 DEAD/DEAH box helicase [Sinorhizobium meliloti]
MFDPITSAIIASAPPLSGLDLDDLPKRLTQAFSEIVAARIELRGRRPERPPEELLKTIRGMQRLASAQEGYVALLPDRENRSAAAFVAASAYQVSLLGTYRPDGYVSYLDGASLSPEVCASLLFLIGEAHADAAECAKRIVAPTDPERAVEAALLNAIRWLCLGRVHLVAAVTLPELPMKAEFSDTAVGALYLELLKGIKNLALRIQSRADLPTEVGGIEPSANFFNRVKRLSIGQLDDIFGTGDPVFSLFPGPLHLANLLLAVDRDLVDSALSRIPTPDQVPNQDWWQIIRRMSRGRPFLWRNHRDAIGSGYLNKGVSAAISFPTGGGKSTLSELKIATALLRDEKVVFLAPTHALVDQTARSLQNTFKTFDFEIFGDVTDEVTLDEIVVLPEAIVTTPERCLLLLTTQPEAFKDLGLVVFDECHLLHPRDVEKSRRSVDAMLALLNLSLVAPNADLLLLSAMMKNTEEIASWVGDLTGRNCLALNLAWKPTRQVRGTVVYAAKRINELNKTLTEARANYPHVNAPKGVTETLTARPFAFFGLLQTWATQDRRDYALLPLLPVEHALSTGTTKKRKTWYLTPNGNHTSTLIAAAAAEADLKTLVFVQSVVLAESAVNEFRDLDSRGPVTLTEAEQDLYRIASEEMGGAESCYISVDEHGNYSGGAAGHHSLLLREERLLHESLFRRADGIKVLFATSTLAQGMNLPSELVIIAGDSRFDPEKEKMAQLEAHELLNAAGRAGRAGENSQGMVLVVPSRVVEFDEEKGLINAHWMTLQSIFSQTDQCLEIDDPTTALLDRIQAGAWGDAMSTYFVSRLPPADADGTDGTLRNVLHKSLAAFKARQRGDEQWMEDRIRAVFLARNQIPVAAEDGWLDRVAGLTGVGIESLRQIAAAFESAETFASTDAAIATLLKWLMADPKRLFEVMRPENVDDFFGVAFGKLSIEEKALYALPIIWGCLDVWMSGAPLKDIESKYPNGDATRCKHARHFVLRMVPDLAFFAGLPARLLTARQTDKGEEGALSIVLSTLGAAVREGCDSPEALAVRMISARRTTSRVAARAEFDLLNAYFPAGSWNEAFEKTQERARNAKILRAFMIT